MVYDVVTFGREVLREKAKPVPEVTDEIRKARMEGLMRDDRGSKQRCSHLNPDIKKLYDEFLGKPLSERSHHLLHTSYQKRELYKK